MKAVEGISPKMAPEREETPGEIAIERKHPVGIPDKYWERLTEFSKDACYLQYGEVSADHPAYDYLKSIVEKLPGTENLGIKMRIIPDRFNANAFALPDGTIAVTSHLFELSEFYEALAGAVAHEKVHVERQHIQKEKIEKRDENATGDFKYYFELGLKKLAAKRLGEYEADLRGVFSDLEKANINPLGFKILLQKFAQREHEHDDVHGGAMDRALNVATGTYLMDLKALSNDLTKIPSDLIVSLKEVPPPEFRAIFSRPKDYPGIFKPYAERVAERQSAIGKLQDPNHILIALSTVAKYAREEGERDYDPDDDACLTALVKKAADYLDSRLGHVKRPILALLLGYFGGVSPERVERFLPQASEKVTLQEVTEAMGRVASAGLFHYSLPRGAFDTEAVQYLKKNNLLKGGDAQSIQPLDDAYFKLKSNYSTALSQPAQGTFARAAERIFNEDTESSPPKTKEEVERLTAVWAELRSRPGADPSIINIFEQNMKGALADEVYDSIEHVVEDVYESLRGKGLDDLCGALSQSLAAFREYSASVLPYNRWDAWRSDAVFDVSEQYLLMRMFSVCARRLQLPRRGEEKEFALRKVFFSKEWNIDSLGRDIDELYEHYGERDSEQDESEGVDFSMDEDRDFIEEAIADIEHEQRVSRPHTEEQIYGSKTLTWGEKRALERMRGQTTHFAVEEEEKDGLKSKDRTMLFKIYNVCCNAEYQKEHGFDNISRNRITPGERGKAFFARAVDTQARGMRLESFLAFINENEARMEQVLPILQSRRESIGNISNKISSACKDSTLWNFPLKDIILISDLVSNPFIRGEMLRRGME